MDWIKNFYSGGKKCGSTTIDNSDSEENDSENDTDAEEVDKFSGDKIIIKIVKKREVMIEEEYFTIRVDKIPKPLENYNYSIMIKGHKVKFASQIPTGMLRGGTFYINTGTGSIYGEGVMYQSALDYCHNDIKDIIKSLNQMMEIDEKKGLRFGKDEKWINSIKEGSKFKFPAETDNTMYIE